MRHLLPFACVTLLAPAVRAQQLPGTIGDAQRNAQNVYDFVRGDAYRQQMKKLEESSWLAGQVSYCLRDVGEALKGNPPSTLVPLKAGGESKEFTLGQLRDEVCKPVQAELEQRKALGPVFQTASNAMNQLAAIESGRTSEAQLALATDGAKACVTAADMALAGGVPGAKAFEVAGQEMTLAEVKEKCAGASKAAEAIAAKVKAEEEAKFAPWTKALRDDKLKVFNDTYRKGMNVYGGGGRVLKSPEDFKGASAWFTYGVNRDGIQPRWSLDIYRWKGMKKAGVSTKNGAGDEPPSSAFK